jgi:hypothetical protein
VALRHAGHLYSFSKYSESTAVSLMVIKSRDYASGRRIA